MSTKISTIHANLVTLIGTTALPNSRRLENVDDLEQNKAPLLRAGWGLQFGSGLNTRRNACPNFSIRRNFTITLTRECPAKDSDMTRREAGKLALLEDVQTLLGYMNQDKTLGGEAVNFDYDSDGAPEEMNVDGQWFVAIELSCFVEYFQTVGG